MGNNTDCIFSFAPLGTLYPFEINLTFLLAVGSLSSNLLFRFRSHLKRLLCGIAYETEKHKWIQPAVLQIRILCQSSNWMTWQNVHLPRRYLFPSILSCLARQRAASIQMESPTSLILVGEEFILWRGRSRKGGCVVFAFLVPDLSGSHTPTFSRPIERVNFSMRTQTLELSSSVPTQPSPTRNWKSELVMKNVVWWKRTWCSCL